jgi:4-hydroxybutyryl-CoA dehydratase / vinylacetyl-CoA-Delta-isomerase
MIRTPEQYVQSLRDGRVVYQDGKRIPDVVAAWPRNVERAASEFYVANLPKNRALFTMMEDGEEISFSFKIPETPADLQRRRDILKALGELGAGGSRLTGIDGLNGVAFGTSKIDAAMGTHYTENMAKYRAWCKKNDPSICAAVSDPKGNRALHGEDPRQAHKDFYVRIVDKKKDGIVINGCKLHISGAGITNELMVLPSRNHDEPGKDYAVACAVPCNAKGVSFLCTGNSSGSGHPMIIFDEVFVPWERVFLAGEWQFSREIATSFARYHRLTAATYKVSSLDALAGLAMLMAKYNGLTHATRIQDMLGWFAMYATVTEALGKAAALSGMVDPESGQARPNPVYTNCAKYWFASQWHEAMKYLQDITGGIAATMPSMKDWENPETKGYLEKYLQGDARYPAEERIKAINRVIAEGSTFNGVLSIHAEGSLATQRMVLYQQADWARFEAAAKYSMGFKVDHPEFKDRLGPGQSPWKMPDWLVKNQKPPAKK